MEQHDFEDDYNWGPIWCDSKATLELFKKKFKTYGDLRAYLEKDYNESYKKWKIERDKYLKDRETIY